MYGNERGCGKGIKGTKREDLYLTTKLANSDHHRVAEAFNESLKKLNTDYVDQYLVSPSLSAPTSATKSTKCWSISDFKVRWSASHKA